MSQKQGLITNMWGQSSAGGKKRKRGPSESEKARARESYEGPRRLVWPGSNKGSVTLFSRKQRYAGTDLRKAFRMYRPITVQGYIKAAAAVGYKGGSAGINTQDCVDGVTQIIESTVSNRWAYVWYMYNMPTTTFTDTNNGVGEVPMLEDFAFTGTTLTNSILYETTTETGSASGEAILNVNDANFAYFKANHMITHHLHNTNPFPMFVECYALAYKLASPKTFNPLDVLLSAVTQEDANLAAFNDDDYRDLRNYPTKYKEFNRQFKVLAKKKIMLMPGENKKVTTAQPGWTRLTHLDLTKETTVPGRTYTVMFRWCGTQGFLGTNLSATESANVGFAALPCNLGIVRTFKETVMACPLMLKKHITMLGNSTTRDPDDNDLRFYHPVLGRYVHINDSASEMPGLTTMDAREAV